MFSYSYTGAWLNLDNLAVLSPPVLQLVVNLLAQVQSAKLSNSHRITLLNDTLHDTQVGEAFCTATVFSTREYQSLPASLRCTFKSYIDTSKEHDNKLVFEAILLANGFSIANSACIASSLAQFVPKTSSKSGNDRVLPGYASITVNQFQAVIKQASKYLSLIRQASSNNSGVLCDEDGRLLEEEEGGDVIEPPLSSYIHHLLVEQLEQEESNLMHTARRATIDNQEISFCNSIGVNEEKKVALEVVHEENESLSVHEDLETCASTVNAGSNIITEALCVAIALVELNWTFTGELLLQQNDANYLSRCFCHIDLPSLVQGWNALRKNLAEKYSLELKTIESAQVTQYYLQMQCTC